jgi:nucleoside-diphosphate-sugar epimerase
MSLTALSPDSSNTQKHTVLVTGASGFLGCAVVRRLIENGHRVLALLHSSAPGDHPRSAAMSEACQFLYGDLHRHQDIAGLVAALRPECCIHCAWDVSAPHYRCQPGNQLWVQSSLNLFQSLHRNGCRWIGVMGTCIEPRENERPGCRYSAAKATLRHRSFELAHQTPTSLCWWKVFQPYGPGEHAWRLVPSLVRAVTTNSEFFITSPDDVRDFIHVEDVARAAVHSLEFQVTGVHELGCGAGASIKELGLLTASIIGGGPRLSFGPPSDSQSTRLVADPASLIAACQWRPQISLRDGLAQLIALEKRVSRAVA